MPASRKLQKADAAALLRGASRLIVSKGKQLNEIALGSVSEDAVNAMLGPTGNLRAPTARAGDTLLVGFSEDAYRRVFGA